MTRGLKPRLDELGPAVVEDIVHRLTDPDGTLSDELLGKGWTRLELIDLHAAATRGTLLELATTGASESWRDPRAPEGKPPVDWETAPDPPTLAEHSLRYVREILAEFGGNKTHAAEALGVDRRTLYRLLVKAGVHTVVPRPRKRAAFKIEKGLAKNPNTCEVTITNLADKRPAMEPSDYLPSAGDR